MDFLIGGIVGVAVSLVAVAIKAKWFTSAEVKAAKAVAKAKGL